MDCLSPCDMPKLLYLTMNREEKASITSTLHLHALYTENILVINLRI